LRFNTLKEKILRGEPSFGFQICIPSPELVEICALQGFEWVFIDAEHGPIGWLECQSLVRACEARGISSIVRVPKLDHSLIAKYLETGVLGIAVPHINTAEQALHAVRSARYAPLGFRGCDDGASRSSAYGLLHTDEGYFAFSNREIIVAVWVEEVEGMQNLDEILQVPGIDAVHFGPGDLALSMGLPGQPNHPEVLAWIAEGRRKALDAGKVIFAEPVDVRSAKEALDYGALLISTALFRLWGSISEAYLSELQQYTPDKSLGNECSR
jgi:4-hydroxy-2-oxoheptanedioate aldolase